jgi:methylated-DNA-[protein]-cysteine S-methyltransferase
MGETTFIGKLDTPIGFLKIIADASNLLKIEFSKDDFSENNNRITQKTKQQLKEYFLEKRKLFELPFGFTGNNFYTKIWRILCTIPYGTTVSYKELAKLAGKPLAFRAVGNANHQNPLPIIIPCHRVIKNDGSIGGYGAGIEIKQYLLQLEKEVNDEIVQSIKNADGKMQNVKLEL